jgi:hypothetical protein
MSDPTYNRIEIDKNPEWRLAFVLSEIQNDSAPIGWSKYLGAAKCLLGAFDISPKSAPAAAEGEGTRCGCICHSSEHGCGASATNHGECCRAAAPPAQPRKMTCPHGVDTLDYLQKCEPCRQELGLGPPVGPLPGPLPDRCICEPIEGVELPWHTAGCTAGRIQALSDQLAEIAELAGPGGDDTPFGRVESAFAAIRATGLREGRAQGMEALKDARDGLQRASQMLSAINESDPTWDRAKAAGEATNALVAVHRAIRALASPGTGEGAP